MSDPMIDGQTGGEPPEGLYRFDRTVNKRVPSLADLTEEDFGFFQEHGYLVIDEVLSEEEIEDGLDGLTALIDVPEFDNVMYESHKFEELEDPEGTPADDQMPYVRRFAYFLEHEERLHRIAHKPELLDVISKLVDGEPDLFQDMALIKPPGGREKPWHQDKAYFDVSLDAPVVGVWIALEEATAENGCMHVIPGSHNEGPVVHFSRRDWQICDTDVQTDKDVMVPLEPGGVLFFDGLIHHGTPPNRTDTMRRALQFHYTAQDAQWVDEVHPGFDSDGKDVYC